jgi:hypothetical protein
MGVRFLYDNILNGAEAETLRQTVLQRVTAIAQAVNGPDVELQDHLEILANTDLVVVATNDLDRGEGANSREQLSTVLQAAGVSTPHLLSIDTQDPTISITEADAQIIRDARYPLVFAVGSVTGWTLRRLRDAVRRISPTVRPSGLIMHSRPQSQREWRAIQAMFDGRCAYLWQTFLPWESPLQDEATLLNEYAQAMAEATEDSLSDGAQRFLMERLNVIDPSDSDSRWSERVRRFEEGADGMLDPTAVLWGLPDASQLNDHGVFGRELSPISTYAAVGAAVHRARVNALEERGPFWHAFDVRDAVRLRYDGIALACLLRWLSPSETWWGDTESEARDTARLILNFMDPSLEIGVFISEILLETALGKVHPVAARAFCEWTVANPEIVEALGISTETELGLSLIRWARPTGLN